ncbi:hypothetical protein LSAT2_010344 [Lamellibrachia satsuma]|nr:hypothetical protein LSAT2_010344 [Lamellibrachia satsuma]
MFMTTSARRYFTEDGVTFCADADHMVRSGGSVGGPGTYDDRRYTDPAPDHKVLGAKAAKSEATNAQSSRNPRAPRMQLPEPYCSARYASYGDELRGRQQQQQFSLRGRHEDDEYVKTCPLDGDLSHCSTGRKMAASGDEPSAKFLPQHNMTTRVGEDIDK